MWPQEPTGKHSKVTASVEWVWSYNRHAPTQTSFYNSLPRGSPSEPHCPRRFYSARCRALQSAGRINSCPVYICAPANVRRYYRDLRKGHCKSPAYVAAVTCAPLFSAGVAASSPRVSRNDEVSVSAKDRKSGATCYLSALTPSS